MLTFFIMALSFRLNNHEHGCKKPGTIALGVVGIIKNQILSGLNIFNKYRVSRIMRQFNQCKVFCESRTQRKFRKLFFRWTKISVSVGVVGVVGVLIVAVGVGATDSGQKKM